MQDRIGGGAHDVHMVAAAPHPGQIAGRAALHVRPGAAVIVQDGALAAAQRRAADHHGGYRIQLHAHPGQRIKYLLLIGLLTMAAVELARPLVAVLSGGGWIPPGAATLAGLAANRRNFLNFTGFFRLEEKP